jgi:hypothetical protein
MIGCPLALKYVCFSVLLGFAQILVSSSGP